MNEVTIAGHLGSDPEVRFTSSGQKVTTLRVAARSRRNVKEDSTIWWKITVWGEQFDKMLSYFKKGSAIIVLGELNKPEIFTDREGRPQISMSATAHHLMFSPFGKPEGAGGSHAGNEEGHQPEMAHAAPRSEQTAVGQGKVDTSFNENEIPF